MIVVGLLCHRTSLRPTEWGMANCMQAPWHSSPRMQALCFVLLRLRCACSMAAFTNQVAGSGADHAHQRLAGGCHVL